MILGEGTLGWIFTLKPKVDIVFPNRVLTCNQDIVVNGWEKAKKPLQTKKERKRI